MMDALDNPQVLVVDGKSTDISLKIAKYLGATVRFLKSRNESKKIFSSKVKFGS